MMQKDVVIVTGAGNGICHYLAWALLEQRYRVAVLDIDLERLYPLTERYPSTLLCFDCDVSDGALVQETITEVAARWHQIDVLINGACLAIFNPFEDQREVDTRREIEVNYFGYVNTIRAVLPFMKAKGRGVIHNISSGVGITGYPGISGYASSKGAIEALTRTLALELAPHGIVVNLMHPPLTRTRSAMPLGVPSEAMSDPERVGRRLASKVGRRSSVITPDTASAVGLFLMRHFPGVMGRFMTRMARRAIPV